MKKQKPRGVWFLEANISFGPHALHGALKSRCSLLPLPTKSIGHLVFCGHWMLQHEPGQLLLTETIMKDYLSLPPCPDRSGYPPSGRSTHEDGLPGQGYETMRSPPPHHHCPLPGSGEGKQGFPLLIAL